MRSSNKSRSRNKNNRNRSVGNVVNRVFDSSGPEGRVRGTPQQIIEKYQGLAHDANLSNDPVAAENFQQHAEHYTRMLSEAQREMAERQAANDARNRNNGNSNGDQAGRNEQPRSKAGSGDEDAAEQSPQSQEPSTNGHGSEAPAETSLAEVDFLNTESTGLVETPESRPAPAPKPKRAPRTRQSAPKESAEPAETPTEPAAE